jgi:DNA-binding beta-propeller fold protein YncE
MSLFVRAIFLSVALAANVGGIYTIDNAASGNNVVWFGRQADGTLVAGAPVASGGMGNGAGFGTQGALAVTPSQKFLVVVNSGSNSISSFKVNADSSVSLTLTVNSGGTVPVSVSATNSLVYVVNAGTPSNIQGFTLWDAGANRWVKPIAQYSDICPGTGADSGYYGRYCHREEHEHANVLCSGRKWQSFRRDCICICWYDTIWL